MALNTKINLSDLTLENMGSWPLAVKVFFCSFVFVMVLFCGYYFDIADAIIDLDSAARKEVNLRAEFENKQAQSASLQAYKLQLREIRQSFGALLRQLPSKTEVPGLLEDISKSGIASGLEFKSFSPSMEVRHDFYAELPITIEVVGTYHQFGEFISRISALDRIVTLHDFIIKPVEVGPPNPSAKEKPDAKVRVGNQLVMQLTAKTYRYMDDAEVKKDVKGEAKNAPK